MKFSKELLTKIFSEEEIAVVFPNLKKSIREVAELEGCKILQKIKAIIEDDSLSDFECAEEIICVFEELGSICGGRHDF